jgi:hypothetical protein
LPGSQCKAPGRFHHKTTHFPSPNYIARRLFAPYEKLEEERLFGAALSGAPHPQIQASCID